MLRLADRNGSLWLPKPDIPMKPARNSTSLQVFCSVTRAFGGLCSKAIDSSNLCGTSPRCSQNKEFVEPPQGARLHL